MRTALFLAIVAATSCSRAEPASGPTAPAPSPEPVPSEPVAVAPAISDAAAAPSCRAAASSVGEPLARMHSAMDGAPYYDRALAAWLAVDPGCRTGRWHLQGAQLMRWRSDPVGGFDDASAAVRAGLAAPADLELLVFVAFTGALGATPSLPPDACDRARKAPPVAGNPSETADRIAYVCGHAALPSAPAAAEAEFARIANQRRYADLALRRAQALRASGKIAAASPFEAAARDLPEATSRAFGATDAEHARLVAAARALR